MPERTFHLDIVTPERNAYSADVSSLVVMASDGYLGVLAGHAPMMTLVGIGEIRVTEPDGQKQVFACGGGFMEVSPTQTTILAESAERPEEIDAERARAAAERARRRLSHQSDEQDIDVFRAEMALQKAILRLRVAGSD